MKIEELEPTNLWKNFCLLSSVPRPSKHEGLVIEKICQWAAGLELDVEQDDAGNLLIKKMASKGCENWPALTFQGHVDMVTQKNSDKVHDFFKDPIELIKDGDWIRANQTTLGADNGVGVAAAMAILEEPNLKHGPLEVLLTVDEEAGMTGAFKLKEKWLCGKYLLNLDSEEEGSLYVGCAGGVDVNVSGSYSSQSVPENFEFIKLDIRGLKGGHSGLDIHLGRGNANLMMAHLIKELSRELNIRLAEFSGGNLRNAIPRESSAVLAMDKTEKETLVGRLSEISSQLKSEFQDREPRLSLEWSEVGEFKSVMDSYEVEKWLNSLLEAPNGVLGYVDSDPKNGVETSSNLAVVWFNDGKIKVQCLVRSSDNRSRDDAAQAILDCFKSAGGTGNMDGAYPGWSPKLNSKLLKEAQEVFKNQYGKAPEIKVIHAGLECGLLSDKYPELEMISFGPTICFPHSPDEKVNISSVGRFYESLKTLVENLND